MALTMCMLRLRFLRPSAQWVIATRCDQKSHLKSAETAGFRLRVIPNAQVGDELRTDVPAVHSVLAELGPENVLCILAVTSCFAPRAPDDLPGLAKLCSQTGVPFLVNNAYGLQSSKCVHLLNEAYRVGRVDAFVQSCDKNFLVPVGGAVIAGRDNEFIASIAALYPGKCTVDF
jgi:O-phospho-L-seryl-tRNASec:L-selenocysteinyl-tRNA synthase